MRFPDRPVARHHRRTTTISRHDQAPAPDTPAEDTATEVRRLRAENTQLREAMASRPQIDQARGILMADEAWDMLRYTSQHTNIKLREVAAAVVAGAAGPPPPQPISAALRRARARFRARRRTAERKE
ncbi:ANTAR domain-containing protein [Streptomyces rimosus]|uniref:ANTAR domain-containing protein n=1 Tax=Streptomyces rimosus TaxID=1927 RepID=UPI00067AB8EA|nr:ANTAR domain-containing protein [Streptomyces rimosus]